MILLLWKNQNIVFSNENHISMFVMPFTLAKNYVCYYGCKYIEQFSKTNQRNTDFLAKVPSLWLYKLAFGECLIRSFLNSTYIKQKTLYLSKQTREKEKQGFREKLNLNLQIHIAFINEFNIVKLLCDFFINFWKLFYWHKTQCILYLQTNTGKGGNILVCIHIWR